VAWTQEIKKSQNANEDNQWSHLLMCILHMIVSFLVRQLSFHVLSWTMHTIPYSGGLNQLWQYWNIDSSVADKRWETSLCMCATFSKVIVVTVSWRILWDAVCSPMHRHQNKWTPKPSMASPLWQCEKCAIIGCNKSRWVCNVVRKWVEDKWNVGVVGWINNQVPTVEPPHDQRHVQVVSKEAFIRNVKNSYSCKRSIKKIYKWRCEYT
jgi:hypothetical protein